MITLPEFTENADYEKGFASHFKAKIAPILENLESMRLVQYAAYKKRLAIGIPLGIAIFLGAGFMSAQTNGDGEDIFKVALFLCALIGGWVYIPIRLYKQEVKSKFMPVICEFFGTMTYSLTGTSSVETQYSGEIFPSFTSCVTEDFVAGEYKAIKMNLHETTLKQRQGKHTVTVFQGLVIDIGFPKNFQGKTLLIKDGGTIGNFFEGDDFKGLQRISLEDPEFEKIFQVFGSDQVEARFLLTTAFMERLLSLAKLRSPSSTPKVQCVFEKNSLIISIPCRQDLFEPRGIAQSALQVDDLHTFLQQMHEVFLLIDVLKLQRL